MTSQKTIGLVCFAFAPLLLFLVSPLAVSLFLLVAVGLVVNHRARWVPLAAILWAALFALSVSS